ncbi:aldolase [Aureobasidium pullulans]|uniref:Fructose-bisphosphate aldolase n=1 Tax=Aureobasidium pullulans TaxID=5580 RepID=A0A4T0D8J3_AURPU|nr:aldolase [Aureobasidium pullulans]THX26077.1 aldolase [Aureobasidium pullulans]THX34837.1 aldolase [Aureobasidium pullulans]THZ47313.1 aldolase [Aureobasidium pullulans]TIA57420.1 aldolase [Aureobasidium pullulans]
MGAQSTIIDPSRKSLAQNKTKKILEDAEKGGYGIIASIVYNVENIVAVVRAAENKRSPLIIQVFPWAITASDGLLVRAAADAAARASVPIAIHLDHAQDEALIRHAADNLPFDSIMVDMSHHEKEENLAKTKELVEYCHARGIATEAEPGRLEGGEDGVADTVDLEGVLTTPEDVEQFIATGVDFLAPAFGNIHGESPYGKAGPQLDYARLEAIKKQANGRVRIVAHGTNEWPDDVTQRVIQAGVSKINVNRLVLDDYLKHFRANAAKMPLTKLIDEGIQHTTRQQEEQMNVAWSTGKAN